MDKEPISVLLLATLPDNGIKSLGSKSLFKFKNQLIIEHQLESIKSALRNREYDITFLCGFDCQRIQRAFSKYTNKFPISIIKQNEDNLNFAGSFLKGLSLAKYNNVLSINYGCLFDKTVITKLTNDISINKLAIAKSNHLNDNIKIGCHINANDVVNVFFDLGQHKYLDMNFWSANTIEYIKNNLPFDNHKHKFMFEIINTLINCDHSFKCCSIDPHDCMLIDNLKILTKSKRVFKNGKIKNKKTKY